MTPTPIPAIPATPKFKRGDVVRLNSGGPEMLVVRVHNRDEKPEWLCTCIWFNKNDDFAHTSFDESWLASVTAPKEKMPPVAPAPGFQVFLGRNCFSGVPAGACVWNDADKTWSAPFEAPIDNVPPNAWVAIPCF